MQIDLKKVVVICRKRAIAFPCMATVIAAGLYFMPGLQPESSALNNGQSTTVAMSADLPRRPEAAGLPGVGDMLQQLELRLQAEPDDARGWALLGRSYEHLDRRREAAEAYEHARALGYKPPVAIAHTGSIRGTVTLDPSLQDEFPATGTVFIFARAVSGPRMPLAVVRKPASRFPMEFELDDSMTMTPALKLSHFNEVIIGARISASGDATARDGDLEGYSEVIRVSDNEQVEVKIDQERLVSPLKLRDYVAIRNSHD